MVSIPLELVIFEDYIKGNEENFEANQIALLGTQLKSNSGEDVLTKQISDADVTLKKLDKESEKLGKDIDGLQAQINGLEAAKKNPQSSAYKNAKSRYETARRNYNAASANYNEYKRRNPYATTNPYTSQRNSASSAMSSARGDMNAAAQAWRNEKQAEIENWGVRELKRQRSNFLFQRLALSTDKDSVMKLSSGVLCVLTAGKRMQKLVKWELLI
jgi:chromosome segregation ATPase